MFSSQLADIDVPARLPEQLDLTLLGISIGGLTIALVIAYVIWRKKNKTPQPTNTPTTRALNRLDTVEHQWQQGKLDARQTAYQLATLLRLGLNLNQLASYQSNSEDKIQWTTTLKVLDALRYSNNNPLTIDQQIFGQIRAWLTHANGSNT